MTSNNVLVYIAAEVEFDYLANEDAFTSHALAAHYELSFYYSPSIIRHHRSHFTAGPKE